MNMDVDEERFSLSDALLSVYPLLDMVFIYLNDADLYIAAAVCNDWKNLAIKESKRRGGFCWFKFNFSSSVCRVQKSINFEHDDVEIGIVPITGEFNLGTYIRAASENDNSAEKVMILEYLYNAVMKNTAKAIDYCIVDCANAGMNCAPFKYQQGVEYVNMCGGLLIPNIPNIRISMFRSHSSDLDKNIRESITKPNEVFKALLAFIDDIGYNTDDAMKTILSGQSVKGIGATGASLPNYSAFKVKSHKPRTIRRHGILGIGFLANIDEAVEFDSYSVASDVTDIDSNLDKLKKGLTMRVSSLAVVITEVQVEAVVRKFQQLFPKTALLFIEGPPFSFNTHELNDVSSSADVDLCIEKSISFLVLTWGKKV